MSALQGGASPIWGFCGAKEAGKSYVAEQLRLGAGSLDSASDIEFSDPMIEAVNGALQVGVWTLEAFRFVLAHQAGLVIGADMPPPNASFHTCGNPGIKFSCPECGLAEWLLTRAHPGLVVTRDNKSLHRSTLIWLGIVIRQLVDDEVWAREVVRRIELARPSEFITVGGVRFPADAALVRQVGGRVIRVVGPNDLDTDPTNAENGQIQADVTVYNRVRRPELVTCIVRCLLADLKADTLQQSYGLS
jgi:hypothetical protein